MFKATLSHQHSSTLSKRLFTAGPACAHPNDISGLHEYLYHTIGYLDEYQGRGECILHASVQLIDSSCPRLPNLAFSLALQLAPSPL